MQFAFAETLPPKGFYHLNKEDYPVLFGYLNNYANQLFEKFNPGIFEAYNWGTIAFYYINQDGSIDGNFLDRQLERVVKQTTPPKFPKELETDKIKVHLVLIKSKYPEINVDYWQNHSYAYISIYKAPQPKLWFKKKTKK